MNDSQSVGRPQRSLFVEHTAVDGVRVVAVRGDIDHDVTDVLREALLTHRDAAPPRVVVDLSGVEFLDSSGVNVLIHAHQSVSAARGRLRIAAARPPVLRVIRLVGIDTLITCHPTVKEALDD
ncbi:STAS domain-containing protein [Streptomyces sp. CRN 30]|uniref:STAS domain-containing protein n=1 Tax=Streptomyces sp. CRN 30 TaxID=3075613 RepID=UPI002A82B38C|nr:STAS domain-containing protein [Streptomyces sp. CRN 30]